MPGTEDRQLLEDYAKRGSERAFATLVDRYTDLVFGIALRKTGDRGTAEEVAQNTFALLARKAESLKPGVILSGWLHRTSMFESSHAIRKQASQKQKMEALAQHQVLTGDAPAPPDLDDLDGAISKLSQADQDVLLLRFNDGLSFREIGEALGKSEDASQKQTSRALAKLNRLLTKRGAALTATALASVMGSEFAKAAPAGLATALGKGALASAPTITSTALAAHTLELMSYGKIVTGITAAALVAALPVAVQQTQITLAGAELRKLVYVDTPPPSAPSKAQPALAQNTKRTPRFATVDDWLDTVIVGGWEWSSTFDRWAEMAKLTPDGRSALLAEFENHPGGGHPKQDLISDLLRQMAHDRPAEALNHAIRIGGSSMPVALLLETWAKNDPEAAVAWFLGEQRADRLEGRAIPNGEESAQTWIMWRMTKAVAMQDLKRGLEIAEMQEGADARWALRGVALAHIASGDSTKLMPASEAINLSPNEKNTVLVSAAQRSVSEFGTRVGDWVVAQSPPERLAENIQALMAHWGASNVDTAEAWIEALGNSALRDRALAGLAEGQVGGTVRWTNDAVPARDVREIAQRIEDESLRKATLARINQLLADRRNENDPLRSNED